MFSLIFQQKGTIKPHNCSDSHSNHIMIDKLPNGMTSKQNSSLFDYSQNGPLYAYWLINFKIPS